MEPVFRKIKVDDIELDITNPRIKQFLDIYQGDITSEQIALALTTPGGSDSTTSYNALKESIKVHGGLIQPIIVNKEEDGKLLVIEGNTRLQIYKEFRDADPSGPWNEISCLIYDNLDEEGKHKIRLQSHLVGPRDWDPYSKASYLNQLSNVDRLPMATIISMCGGKAAEINKLINAYRDMEKYYRPIIEQKGMRFSSKDFSKFSELQNASIIQSLNINGYSKEDFAKWVINGNIDNAQNVRQLPSILKNIEATEEFLKSNVTNAMKKLAQLETSNLSLKDVEYYDLANELVHKLRNISYVEGTGLSSDNPEFEQKRSVLQNVYSWIQDLLHLDKDE